MHHISFHYYVLIRILWDFDVFLILPMTIETGSANGIFQSSHILGVMNRMQPIGCNSETIRWIEMPVWGERSLGFLFESQGFQHLQTLVGHIQAQGKATCVCSCVLPPFLQAIMEALAALPHKDISLELWAPTWKTAALERRPCPQQFLREQINKLSCI